MTNPLSDDYRAGHEDGFAEGWKAGWLERGAELYAIATASGPEFTTTERRGVWRAYQRQVAAMEGGAQ